MSLSLISFFFPHKFTAADATVCLICSDPVGAAAAATAALITGLVGLVASPRARPHARLSVCLRLVAEKFAPPPPRRLSLGSTPKNLSFYAALLFSRCAPPPVPPSLPLGRRNAVEVELYRRRLEYIHSFLRLTERGGKWNARMRLVLPCCTLCLTYLYSTSTPISFRRRRGSKKDLNRSRSRSQVDHK